MFTSTSALYEYDPLSENTTWIPSSTEESNTHHNTSCLDSDFSTESTNFNDSNPEVLPPYQSRTDETLMNPSTLSTRPSKIKFLPSKFSDYTNLPSLYKTHTSNAIIQPTTIFKPSYNHFLANVTKISEPYSYNQAVLYPEWCTAMAEELTALEANKTWEVVPAPPHHKLVGCRWIYKVKYLSNGEAERYKARLVAKGFTQTEEVDYFDTFVPVAKMTILKFILTFASINNGSLT